LVARSTSGPVREAVTAPTEVQHGQCGVLIEVCEPSENRMVAGSRNGNTCGTPRAPRGAKTWCAKGTSTKKFGSAHSLCAAPELPAATTHNAMFPTVEH
jgi:hypothetical protein